MLELYTGNRDLAAVRHRGICVRLNPTCTKLYFGSGYHNTVYEKAMKINHIKLEYQIKYYIIIVVKVKGKMISFSYDNYSLGYKWETTKTCDDCTTTASNLWYGSIKKNSFLPSNICRVCAEQFNCSLGLDLVGPHASSHCSVHFSNERYPIEKN